jgi:hypothetical protein
MTRALVILMLLCSPSFAEPARVAIVDTRQLFDKGGIAAWFAARAKLDAEEPTFKVVESPDGQKANAHADISDPQMRKLFTEMDRDSARSKAWGAHESEVLDPIEADVMRAIEKYAAAHGIGILLDRGKLDDALLVVAAGVDITNAFIKDYNAKAKAPKK